MKSDLLVENFYYALPNNGSQEGINSTTSRMKEAKICAEIAEQFAIDFADWILKKCNYSGEDSNKGSKYHIKGLDGLALYYPATYTIEELLQIYKNEKDERRNKTNP